MCGAYFSYSAKSSDVSASVTISESLQLSALQIRSSVESCALLCFSAAVTAENKYFLALSDMYVYIRKQLFQNFSDRSGDDIHFNDTMQEMISLSDRFGLTITFLRPNKLEYQTIVSELAGQYALDTVYP